MTREEYNLRLSLATTDEEREALRAVAPMPRLTASKFGLALQCIFPWTSGLEWDHSTSYQARLGKAFHRYAELHGQVSPGDVAEQQKLTPALSRRLRALAYEWERWASRMKYHETPKLVELKLAIHPETFEARIIHDEGERNYSSVPDGWVTGTLDLVRDMSVSDYKTGYTMDPSQMHLQELMVCRVAGWERAALSFEKFDENNGHASIPVPVQPIRDTAIQLRSISRRIRSRDQVATPSYQACQWCPVRADCPHRMKQPATINFVQPPAGERGGEK